MTELLPSLCPWRPLRGSLDAEVGGPCHSCCAQQQQQQQELQQQEEPLQQRALEQHGSESVLCRAFRALVISAGCIGLLVASVLLLQRLRQPAQQLLRAALAGQGDRPLLYILTYAVAGLAVPAPLLSVLGGVIMGPTVAAVAAVLAGSLAAALLSFGLSRLLLRGVIERRCLRRSRKLRAMDAALGRGSLPLLLCARLLLPFTFNNYFMGATAVSVTAFAFATALTGLPFATLYTLIGGELGSLDAAFEASSFSLPHGDVSGQLKRWVSSPQGFRLALLLAALCTFAALIRPLRAYAERAIYRAGEQQPARFAAPRDAAYPCSGAT